MRLKILLVLLFVASNVFAQKVATYQKTLGGTGADLAQTIIETAEGGFMLLGITNTYGSGDYDLMVTRTDSLGREIWSKTYGGTSDESIDMSYSRFSTMIQTKDSTYVIASSTKSYGAGNSDFYVLKIDKAGTVLWTRTYGGTSNDAALSIKELAGGGFAILGMTQSYGSGKDALLITTNDTGGVVWAKAYGGSSYENVFTLAISALDSSFYIGGESKSTTQSTAKALIMKIHKTGRLTWSKVIGSNGWDLMYGLVEDTAGNIFVSGQSEGFAVGGSGDCDFYLIKLDSSGSVSWSKTYGNSTYRQGGRDIFIHNNKIYWNGWSRVGAALQNVFWAMELDLSGGVNWLREYSVAGNTYWPNYGTHHGILRNGGLITVGAITGTYSAGDYDYYLVKTNSSGISSTCSPSTATYSVQNKTPTSYTHSFSTTSVTPSVSKGYLTTTDTLSEDLICEPFIADFTWLAACAGEVTQFTDSTYKNADKWLWTFNDTASTHTTDTSQNPIHIFAHTGTYTVKLKAWKGSSVDSMTKTVTVYDLPTGSASGPANVNAGDTFQVLATGGVKYEWFPSYLFNDNTLASPKAAITSKEALSVRIYNEAGCYITETVVVDIDQAKIKYQRYYGGSNYDHFSAAVEASNRDLFVVGTSSSYTSGSSDILLTRTTANGDVKWTKRYGGSSADVGQSILSIGDTALLVIGNTTSFSLGSQDVIIFCLDTSGTILWSKTYGSSGTDDAYQAILTPQGHFVVAGVYGSDHLVFKIAKNGGIIWSKYYGSTATEKNGKIIESVDGNYLITGNSLTSAGDDAVIMKIDTSGGLLWYKTYGGSGTDGGHGIAQFGDGNIIINGSTTSPSTAFKQYIIKTDSTGGVIWSKYFSGTSSQHDRSSHMVRVSATEVVLQGGVASYGGGSDDICLTKIDSSATVKWNMAYGKNYSDYNSFALLTPLANGGYLAGGRTKSFNSNSNDDGFLIRTDPMGWSGCNEKDSILSLNNFTISVGTPTVSSGTASLSIGSNGSANSVTLSGGIGCIGVIANFGWANACQGIETQFLDSSKNTPTSWEWTFYDSSSTVDTTYSIQNPKHIFKDSGTFKVKLVAWNASSKDSIEKLVTVKSVNGSASGPTHVCKNDSVQLSATEGVSYAWYPSTYFNDTTLANPKAVVDQKRTFYVRIYNANGCYKLDSVVVDTVPDTYLTYTNIRCVSFIDDSTIKVTWSPYSASDSAYFGYYVLTSTAPGGTSHIYSDTIYGRLTDTFIYRKGGLLNSGPIDFRIYSANKCGKLGYYGFMKSVVLTSSMINDKTIKLEWNYPQSVGANSIEINDGSGWKVLVASVSGLTYNLSLCDFNGKIRLRFPPYNSSYPCSSYSNVIERSWQDTTPPQKPDIRYIYHYTAWNTNPHVYVYTWVAPEDQGSTVPSKVIVSRSKNGGPFVVVDTVTGDRTSAFNTWNTQIDDDNANKQIGDRFCYRLQGFDSCGNLTDIDEKCSPLLTVTPGNLVMNLSMNTMTGLPVTPSYSYYYWYRRKASSTSYEYLGFTFNDSTYTDTDVNCYDEYNYFGYAYSVINYNGSFFPYGGYSNYVQDVSFDTIAPEPAKILYAEVNDVTRNRIVFTPPSDSYLKKFFVYGSKNGGTFNLIDSVQSTDTTWYEYSHQNVNPNLDKWCYYITVEDSCTETRSVPSDTHCVIKLDVDVGYTTVDLTWTPYEGDSVKSYEIKKFDGTSWKTVTNVNGSTLSYIDSGLTCGTDYVYVISASLASNYVSASNIDTYTTKSSVIIHTLSGPSHMCTDDSAQLYATGGVRYAWWPANLMNDTTLASPKGLIAEPTKFYVRIYDSIGCYITDSITVDTVNITKLKPPTLRCASIEGDSIVKVSWTPTDDTTFFGSYIIARTEPGGSSFIYEDTIYGGYGVSSYTYSNEFVADTAQIRFKIYSINTCGSRGDASSEVKTLIHKGTIISNITGDYGLSLQVPHPDTASRYYFIERNSGAGWHFVDSVKQNALFSVTNYSVLRCSDSARYRVYYKNPTTNCRSYSNVEFYQWSDTVENTTYELRNLYSYASFGGKMMTLYGNSVGGSSFLLYRSANGGPFNLIDTVPLNSGTGWRVQYTDSSSDRTQNHYCYKLIAVDSCGNTGEEHIRCMPKIEVERQNLRHTITITPGKEAIAPYQYYSTYFRIIRKDSKGNTKTFNVFYKRWNTTVTDSDFVDTTVVCNETYTYSVEQYVDYNYPNYNSATQRYYFTISKDVSVTAYDSIPPQPAAIVHVDIATATTAWLTFTKSPSPDAYYYHLYGTINDTGYKKIITLTKNDFTGGGQKQHLFTDLNTAKNRYCFYVVVQDSCGENYSDPVKVCAPELRTTAGNQRVTLNWHPYEGADPVTMYLIKRSTDGVNFTPIDTVNGTDTAYSDVGLECNKKYTYRIDPRFPQPGTSGTIWFVVKSDTSSATPYDTIPPAEVNLRYATVINGSSIALNFDKVADVDVNRYEVWRSDNGGAYQELTTLYRPASSPVTYINTGLNTTTNTYCYKIYALDSCEDNISPTAEEHCVVQLSGAPGNNANRLSWSAYEGFGVVKEYVIQLFDTITGWQDYDTVSSTTNNYLDTLLPCNIERSYRIKTVENAGDNEVSYSDEIDLTPFDTIKPEAPSLHFVTVNNRNIELSWTKSSSPDVLNYVLYRKSASGGSWTTIDTVGNVNAYTDSTVTVGAYCYYLQAIDSCAENMSLPTDTHCNVYLTNYTVGCEKSIYLDWTSYEGWGSVDKYELYRSVNGGSESLLTTLGNTTYTYKDSLLDYHSEYCYRIKAYENGSSYFSWSNDSCNQTFFVDTPQMVKVSKIVTSSSAGELVVKWESQAGKPHIDYHRLYYRSGSSGAFSLLQDNIPLTNDSFIHTGINTRIGEHYYYLLTVDSCGEISDSSSIHKSMDITVTVGQLLHNIHWTPYEGFDVKEYRIERLQGGDFVAIDTVPPTDTFNIQFPAPCNYHIQYRIAAVSQDEVIAWSDTMGRVAIDTVFANPATMHQLTVVDDNQTYMSFTGSDSLDVYAYSIQRAKDGQWGTAGQVLFSTPSAAHDYTDTTNTLKEQLCYTIITLDSCLNATMSDTFCAIQLRGEPMNLSNFPHWSKFKGYSIDEYALLYYNQSTNQWDTLSKAGPNDTAYLHEPLQCNVPVSYRVAGRGADYNTMSDTLVLVPYDTIRPAVPPVDFATVDNGSTITLNWQPSTSSDVRLYEIRYKAANSDWIVADTLDRTYTYTFSSLNALDSTYSFGITAMDSCAYNRSNLSEVHSTIQLQGEPKNLSNLLDWSAYEGFDVEKYYVYKHDGAGWLLHDSTDGVTTGYLDTGLQCNIPYYYRIEALSSDPFRSFSDSISLTPFDTIKPAVPPVDFATVDNGTTITLNWQPSTSSDVRLYEIRYKTANNDWIIIDTLDRIYTYTFTGLNALDSTYSFGVTAMDSCAYNRSELSIIHSTIQLDGEPKNLSNLLAWSAYQGFTTDKYYIYRHDGTQWLKHDSVNGSTTNYLDTGLQCNILYFYKIVSLSATAGFLSHSDSISLTPFDTIKPAAPPVDFATVDDGSTITLNWQPSSSDVKLYEIWYRSGNGSWQNTDTVELQYTYTFTGLNTVDSSYDFRLVAIDSCADNRSDFSELHRPIQLDGEPKNLSNLLTWAAYTGFDVKEYYVHRINGGNWEILDTVPGTQVNYTDTPLACNVVQYYKISALDATEQFISYSDSIELTPFDTILPPAPVMHYASVQSDGSIKLGWNWDPASDVKYYEVWRNEGLGSFSLINTVTYDSIYIDNGVQPQQNTYYYHLIAIDSCQSINRSAPSDTDRIMNLTLATGACEPVINLEWTAYEQFPQEVDEYRVYRSIDGFSFSLVHTAAAPNLKWDDDQVQEGTRYIYKIKAVDKETGFFSYSDTISLEPWVFPAPGTTSIIHATVDKTGITNGSTTIRWNTYDNLADTFARGYRLYHREGETGAYTMIYEEKDFSKTNFTHTGINTQTAQNYYYVKVFNLCDVEGDREEVHSPVNVTLNNQNLKIDISWTSYKGRTPMAYELYKKEDNGSFELYKYLPATDTFYTDTNVYCHKHYTYQVSSVLYVNNKHNSWSDTAGATAFDTIPPPAPKLHVVSVVATDDAVGEIAVYPSGSLIKNRSGFNIYRKAGNGSFSLYKTIDELVPNFVWDDLTAATSKLPYSYYFTAIDSCGNESMPSDTHTTVHLAATAMNHYIELKWTPYVGWPFNGVQYFVERRQDEAKPWTNIVTLGADSLSYHDSDVTCHEFYQYRITARDVTFLSSHSNTDSDTAFEIDPPETSGIIRVTVNHTGLNDGIVQIDWEKSTSPDAAYYNLYRSEDKGNTWQLIAPQVQGTSYLDMDLNTEERAYRYYILVEDFCGNINTQASTQHQTMVLTASPGNEEVQLNWTPYEGWDVDRYEIIRDGGIFASVPSDSLSYINTQVSCVDLYDFVIRAVSANNNNIVSNSNHDSARAYDHNKPAAGFIKLVTVTMPNDEVYLEWEPSWSFDERIYYVYRQSWETNRFELIDSTTKLDYTYKYKGGISAPDCFYLQAVDLCGNMSDRSNRACIIYLEGRAENGYNALEWNQYTDFWSGVKEYKVFRNEDSIGYLYLTTTLRPQLNDSALTEWEANQYCYRVQAVENEGFLNATSFSTELCIYPAPIVYMPNTFTPQSDPDFLNDDFGPIGSYIKSYELKIYNRWGQLVHTTETSEPWDGILNGRRVPEGVYMYQLRVKGFNNEEVHQKGTVTILR